MATMEDAARRAGVSVTTVSHVLNETRPVRPETAARVRQALAEVGYRRNALAAALATSRSRMIALCMSAAQNPYFSALVRSIETRASTRGYSLLMVDTHEDVRTEDAAVRAMLEKRVDGLILAPSAGPGPDITELLAASGTPAVIVDRLLGSQFDEIASENHDSARTLADHLLALGHERLLVLTGQEGLSSTTERLRGVTAALTNHQDAHVLVRSGNSSLEGAFEAVRQVASSGDPMPTAIISLNNAMTIGAMRALHALGVRVPHDVALAAYDDFEWADSFEPQLTAISQDVTAIGTRAIDLLLERMSGYEGPARTIRVPATLMHRNSCGCGQMDGR